MWNFEGSFEKKKNVIFVSIRSVITPKYVYIIHYPKHLDKSYTLDLLNGYSVVL